MSLSPWDVGSVFSFEFAAYHSRKNSLMRATRGRKRPTSYRRAVRQTESSSKPARMSGGVIEPEGSSITSGIAEEDDYIEKILQRPGQPERRVDHLLTPSFKEEVAYKEEAVPTLSSITSPHRHNITIALNDEPIDRIKTRCRSPVCLNVGEKNGGQVEICRGCRNTTGPRIRRNLIVLCLAYILVYAAFRALQNLMCTIHQTYGPLCMTVLYSTMSLTCIGVPQYTDRLNPKWCILIGVASYLVWLAANLHASLFLLLPASFLAGAGQTIAWNAQLVYLSTLFKDYYEIKKKAAVQISKYNSLFLVFFQTTHIWGNLAVVFLLRDWTSSLLETPTQENKTFFSLNTSVLFRNNLTELDSSHPSLPVVQSCGKFDCGNDYSAVSASTLPGFSYLIAVLMTMVLLGFIIILIMLQKVDSKTYADNSCSQTIVSNLSQLVKDKTFRLLIPLLIFNGFEQAFIYADYNKSYVACSQGTDAIGWSMLALGFSSALVSFILDNLNSKLPRECIIVVALVLHCALLIFLIIYEPRAESTWVIVVMSILWGICDAAWITQANVLIGTGCFANSETAFINFRVLQSLGAALAFALSCFICFEKKIYVLLCLLVLSGACYVPAERRIRDLWRAASQAGKEGLGEDGEEEGGRNGCENKEEPSDGQFEQ